MIVYITLLKEYKFKCSVDDVLKKCLCDQYDYKNMLPMDVPCKIISIDVYGSVATVILNRCQMYTDPRSEIVIVLYETHHGNNILLLVS